MTIELNKELGFLRIGAAVPQMRIADIDFNINAMIDTIRKSAAERVQILAFPEMSITGYTIGDLVAQQILLTRAEDGLGRLLAATSGINMIIIAGIPLAVENKIFNCAVVFNSGRILGIIPKTLLPSSREFYETRWFTPARDSLTTIIELCGQTVDFGTDILFQIEGLKGAVLGVEICEDLWVPLAPHEYQSLAGATVLFNISASNEILGKADWRRSMVASESGRCLSAYCLTSSGIGESSNDVVYSGHALIAENGVILEESRRLAAGDQLLIADIDLDRLNHDRYVQTSFHDTTRQLMDFRIIKTSLKDISAGILYRGLNPHPFVPDDPARRAERCKDIFSMQVAALAQKLSSLHRKNLIIGVSGGLDSTLALLAAVKTMDFMKLPRQNVFAYTMPGFGTTSRTEGNATKLCKALGVSFEKIDISRTSEAHLKDIKHNNEDEDVVFENVQARYRTELLFNIANHIGGIVLGTGDLTEIALGWATFSGDHMSHYHINCSVPKTLVQYLVRWVADEELVDSKAPAILYDILDTPISPELKRPVAGHLVQKSEDIIGPVELADFFLYPFVRFGIRPGKILYIANEIRKQGTFYNKYTLEELHRWLESFLKRFFANQFKRTCLPEGPKVGSVSLSPRGDWRMPSDADVRIWLDDLESMYNKLKPQKPQKRAGGGG